MAKILDKSTIVSLGLVRPWHVSQSVDAFTGIDAYDITISGSLTVTGSTDIDGDVTANSFTGSLYGTSSWAESALTASYAPTAISSSYALTASYVENAQTASYVLNAQTSSYVENAQTASYVENAVSASYVLNAVSSSYALTASYVTTNPLKYYAEPSTPPNITPTSSGTDAIAIGDGAVANSDNQISLSTEAGALATSAENSFFVGYLAGKNSKNIRNSIVIGREAGENATGSSTYFQNHVWIGDSAGYGYSGSVSSDRQTVMIGSSPGFESTRAREAIMIGSNTGYQSNTVEYSVFLGGGAGYQVSSSIYSTFLGYSAAFQSKKVDYSIVAGYYAGFRMLSSSNAVFIGSSAASPITGSDYSIGIGEYAAAGMNYSLNTIALGRNAGRNTTRATSSIYIGTSAGYNTTGSYSTYIGYGAGYNSNELGDSVIIIGPNASLPSGSTAAFNIGNVLYGTGIEQGSTFLSPNTSPTIDGKVGIGVIAPTSGTLEVNGNVYATSFTGSLEGTASYATQALSASYAPGIESITQTDVIYVDSVLGADNADTYRGDINLPYATVEYALANTNNSGSVTGDTTNSSATITNVSDTTNIKVGQYITGTNIPYNSVVISKTANTIVLSQTATGNGSSLTITWWTPKLLRLSGDFVATSNWWKQGFYFDSNPTVTVQWGAFTLFNINAVGVIPYINNGEFSYYGTTSTSKWLYNTSNTATNDTNYVFKFNAVHTDTTSYAITLGTSPYFYGKYIISGNVLNAKFGYAFGIGWSFQNIYVDIDYTYGLLGGVSYQFFQGLGHWNGSITTPASVYAINGAGGAGAMQFNDGKINGSVYFDGQSAGGGMRIPFFSDIVSGTTCNLKNTIMYGKVPDNCILNGNVDLYGYHSSYIYVDTGYNRIFQQPLWGVVVRNSATAEVCANMGLYSITTQNTSKCIINATVTAGGGVIASGSKLIVNGELSVPYLTINGELINNNTTTITTTTATISSTGILRNYKNLQSTSTSTGSALITKDGGNLYLYPGSYLKVANGRGPLNCTANTTGSRNIYNFSSITNSDGSTYGLLIPFSGSSFAPIDLVGGVLYENTNY